MNPQHSSPARTASRCRDALQVKYCAEYKFMHVNVYITSRDSRHIAPYGRLLSYCVTRSVFGARTTNTESVFRPQIRPELDGSNRPSSVCRSDSQRQSSLIDKHNKFNRMNGSPGDPPANRMHTSKQKESLLLFTVSRVIHSARRPAGRQQHKEIQ